MQPFFCLACLGQSNKTKIIMKKKTLKVKVNSIGMYLACLIVGLCTTSCDLFESDDVEDAIPKTGNNRIIVPPYSSAIIDLSGQIEANEAVTVDVLEDLKYGNLTYLSGKYLKYTPKTGVAKASEKLQYSVRSGSSNVLFSGEIELLIANPGDSICENIAVEDSFIAELNSSTLFDVLSNDFTCDYLGHKIEILSPPKQGTASVIGDRIQYQSGASSGEDTLIYRILNINNERYSDALATISVQEGGCVINAMDDRVMLSDSTVISELYIPVFDNDHKCLNIQTEIIGLPINGLATVYDQYIHYKFSGEMANDKFVYRICSDTGQDCDEAEVSIEIIE